MNSPVNILLVDDEPRNLDVLESILDSPDYRLVRALRGEDALMALLNAEFAVIVLDIHMPGMSGIELANLIKQRKRTEHIPIIFLTAYFQEDKDVLHGYEVGAVDYLNKPINATILRSKIAVFVDLFRKTRALAITNQALESEIAERRKADEALRRANSELEARVQERTADLSHANRQLRASEDRYRLILENALEYAIFTLDKEGRVTTWNAGAQRILGYEESEILGQGLEIIFSEEDRKKGQLDLEMGRAAANGRAQDERWHLRKGGNPFWATGLMMPLRDDEGRLLGFLKILRDGTARKQAEDALRDHEAQLRAITDITPVMLTRCSRDERYLFVNHACAEVIGLPPEKIVGQPVREVLGAEAYLKICPHIERVLQGQPVDYEAEVAYLSGPRVVRALYMPDRDEHGNVIGWVASITDITERKRIEEALRASEARLSAAVRAKDDFLATLSHELRTPLNPVLLLASEGAEKPDLPPSVRADFAIIRKNVELEARLIDDLLDLTRIAQGKLALDIRPHDVHAVLHDAIENVQADLRKKQIDLVIELAAKRYVVLGDDVRLQQIFWNILANAVKFTPESGRLTVESCVSPENDRLTIKFVDTGIGMTFEEMARVFDAFSQGDHAVKSSHRFGGIGLGLAISRKLVELQNGTIRAFSAGRNQGSTFLIELPLASIAEEEKVRARSKAPSPVVRGARHAPTPALRRVLLVEDHGPTRDTLALLLGRRRFIVVTAGSVSEALALAHGRDFDLLISDIGLPDGNGYDLMMKLSKHQRLKGIALTGYGMEQDIARSRAAGFVAHLTKPVGVQSLESALALASAASSLQG